MKFGTDVDKHTWEVAVLVEKLEPVEWRCYLSIRELQILQTSHPSCRPTALAAWQTQTRKNGAGDQYAQ